MRIKIATFKCNSLSHDKKPKFKPHKMKSTTKGKRIGKAFKRKRRRRSRRRLRSSFELEVIRLVNQVRGNAGLHPLTINSTLSAAARLKSTDMRNNNYFSHTSPIYGTPEQLLQRFGVDYRSLGENIAGGQPTPKDVMRAWMNSPGHRANILDPEFTDIGVGYAKGGSLRHYWTQIFIQNL